MGNIPYTNTAAERAQQAQADLADMRNQLLEAAGVTSDLSTLADRHRDNLQLLRQLAGGQRQIDAVWGSTFSAMMWTMECEANVISLRVMIAEQERHVASFAA